ncbi:MAG: BatA domain-containing protein [Planctomycetia bacterium]|nr:BatA domain-containing protein [Planctomycetia bacterium]
MTWERPEFWWFLFLALVPWGIYRWVRWRIPTIPWGAIRFLRQAEEKLRWRTRFWEIFLLALQMAGIFFLAVGVLQPTFPWLSERSVPGEEKRSANRVIWFVLDNSGSMQAKFPPSQEFFSTPQTRWEMACRILYRQVEQLPEGTLWGVFPMVGERGKIELLPQEEKSLPAIRRRLETLEGSLESGSVTTFLESLARQIQKEASAHSPVHQEIVFLSDFQWDDSEQATIQDALQKLSEKATLTAIPMETLVFNAGIAEMTWRKPPFFPNQETEIEVRVENFAPQPLTKAKLELFQRDGTTRKSMGQRWVTIPGGGMDSVCFSYTFTRAGEEIWEAELTPPEDFGDSLAEDNHRFFEVKIPSASRFLIWESWNREFVQQPMAGTLYLQAALRGILTPTLRDADLPMEIESVMDEDLSRHDLSQVDVLWLCGIPAFSVESRQAVEKYLREGGILVAFASAETVENLSGLASFWPLQPQEWVSFSEDEEPEKIVGKEVAPFLQPLFQEGRLESWEKIPILAYIKGLPAEKSEVWLRLRGGNPLLVWRPVGKGEVCFFTTTADLRGTPLPLTPFYVPLLEELLQKVIRERATKLSSVENFSIEESRRETSAQTFRQWQHNFASEIPVRQEAWQRFFTTEKEEQNRGIVAIWSLAGLFLGLEMVLRTLGRRG